MCKCLYETDIIIGERSEPTSRIIIRMARLFYLYVTVHAEIRHKSAKMFFGGYRKSTA